MMKLSYDYEELLQEFKEELEDEVLTLDSEVYILRKDEPIFGNYYPIIDWYYLEDNERNYPEFKEDFPKLRIEKLSDVLSEMEEMNRII